jgi:hypothetical protein
MTKYRIVFKPDYYSPLYIVEKENFFGWNEVIGCSGCSPEMCKDKLRATQEEDKVIEEWEE